ncbi:MAG TPA: APC family permease [Rhizomicrobium sp.]|jgi:APA family basic amino acid/polyamine antiporter
MVSITAGQARPQLLRILGASFGAAAAIGATIGAGIMRSPSIIAGEVPGTALILGLWALGAVQALLAANMWAEMGTAIPKSGGAYNFAHRALGDVAGLVVGWTDWVSFLAAIAATSVSFGEFLPIVWPAAGAHKIGVAIAVQAVLYATNALGLREGRAVQEATSFTKAAMLFVFVIAAVVLVAPAEPETHIAASPLWRWGSIILAYQLILGAYAGWWQPIYFAGENVDPARSIPRAMLFGVLLTATLYITINAALLHALGPQGVAASPLPFTTVLSRIGGTMPAFLFALTAMVTVSSATNAQIMGAPRILFALSGDRLLPRAFQTVNRGGTPVVALAASAVGSIALALSGAFALVFGLIGTLNTMSNVVSDVAFFTLRRREPQLARPWRALGYPLLPALVLLIDATLLALFASADHIGVAIAVGLVLFCIPFAWIAHRARTA